MAFLCQVTLRFSLVCGLDQVFDLNAFLLHHDEMHDVADTPKAVLNAQLLLFIESELAPALAVSQGSTSFSFNLSSSLSIGLPVGAIG